jgi:hypothetical protein
MTLPLKLEASMKQSTETKVALLEQSIGHISETLIRLERKMDIGLEKVDKRFDLIDKKFEDIEKKLEKFDARLWSNFYWTLSTMFTLSCAGAAVLAKGFGWFN